MAKQIKSIEERGFVYKACCEEKKGKFYESCKRLAGLTGWWVALACVAEACGVELYFTHTLSGITSGLLITIITSSTVLIGAKTFVSAFKSGDTDVSVKELNGK